MAWAAIQTSLMGMGVPPGAGIFYPPEDFGGILHNRRIFTVGFGQEGG